MHLTFLDGFVVIGVIFCTIFYLGVDFLYGMLEMFPAERKRQIKSCLIKSL